MKKLFAIAFFAFGVTVMAQAQTTQPTAPRSSGSNVSEAPRPTTPATGLKPSNNVAPTENRSSAGDDAARPKESNDNTITSPGNSVNVNGNVPVTQPVKNIDRGTGSSPKN